MSLLIGLAVVGFALFSLAQILIWGGMAITSALLWIAAAGAVNAVVLVSAYRRQPLVPGPAGAIEVRDGRICLGPRPIARLEALSGADVRTPPMEKPRVQLYDTRGKLVRAIEVDSEEQAQALLEQARLGETHGVQSYTLPPRFLNPLTTLGLLLAAMLVVLALAWILPSSAWMAERVGTAALPLILTASVTVAAIAALLLGRATTRLRIEPDGLRVRGRFIPYRQIATVTRWSVKPDFFRRTASHGFDVVLVDDSRISLKTSTLRARGDRIDADDYVAAAVEAAWERASSG